MGSRLVIPIVTDYHCYWNPGFLITWVSNIFFFFHIGPSSGFANNDKSGPTEKCYLYSSLPVNFFIAFLNVVIYSSLFFLDFWSFWWKLTDPMSIVCKVTLLFKQEKIGWNWNPKSTKARKMGCSTIVSSTIRFN